MKKQWKSFSEIQLKRFRLLRDNRHLISEQLIVFIGINLIIITVMMV